MKPTPLQCSAFTLFLIIAFTMGVSAQTYVGSQRCMPCHSGIHADWKTSGHPYKVQQLVGGQPPAYPTGLSSRKKVGPEVDYLLKPGVPQPPQGYTWEQVGFVMGGYHSNARFMDTEGYVIIGPNAQYNLTTDRWVQYDQATPGRKKYEYSCYRCHTTGASAEKTPAFDAFPGIEGSWAEPGVGCEGCHGKGSDHVTNPSNKPPKDGLETCNNCHARDRTPSNTRVEWLPTTVKGTRSGFIRHREQGDMLVATRHGKGGMTCASCHNPHKSVYYEKGGIKDTPSCETCHPNKSIPGHTAATCLDCHMPFAARNGDASTQYVSEQSAHYWKILTSPITMLENLDSTFVAGKKYIAVDGEGISGLTLDYTCLQCHVSNDVAWAGKFAKNMHLGIVSAESPNAIPSAFGLLQNYPNPFNPSTTIAYNVPVRTHVRIDVMDAQGRLVVTPVDGMQEPGRHSVVLQGDGLPSGVYFYRMVATDGPTLTRKMVLMK